MIKSRPMLVSPTTYIFPPRSQDAIPFNEALIFAELDWVGQLKYNGNRCLIKYSGTNIELWNRHAEQFRTYKAPSWLIQQLHQLREQLNLSTDHWHLLDGELLDHKHIAIRDTIVIWDILVHNNEHLLNSTYGDRYNWLHDNLDNSLSWNYKDFDFGIRLDDNILMPRNYTGVKTWQDLWTDVVNKVNLPYTIGKPGDKNYSCKPLLEGLVFKDLMGKLEMGFKEKNNHTWMCRSRVETGRHKF